MMGGIKIFVPVTKSQESSGRCGYILGNENASEITACSWVISLIGEGVERGW